METKLVQFLRSLYLNARLPVPAHLLEPTEFERKAIERNQERSGK